MRVLLFGMMALLACLPFSFEPERFGQARTGQFERVSCEVFQISDGRFECGYVNVPEFHAQPTGAQIKLAVAILPQSSGAGATPTQSALVVAQGGPGGSSLDTFASFFEQPALSGISELRAARDIVLYDQRGTLYAKPALMCPEELENTFATIEREISHEESLRLSQEAALACRARLVAQGVHLDAYNSIENALDIEDVRRALGYDTFDFYGVSYGTLLALHGLRETPGTFRSVILDAVVPAQTNPNSAIAESQQRAFEELFTRCAGDTDCASAFPNLAKVFYEEVDALNQKPARVPLEDRETGKIYNAVVDGDTWMNILFQFIYDSEFVPALPKMIYDAQDGIFTLAQAFYPVLIFDRTFAGGMYYSVMCAEDADFTVKDLTLEGVDTRIARAQTRDTAWFLDLCAKWNVPPLGARADEPVTAHVPTLVFSGDFDPITPPPFGQQAAETIAPSYVFEFPAYGHGAITSGDCPLEMMAAFVKEPEHAPNAQCIRDTATRVKFISRADYILNADIGKVQLALLQGTFEMFLAPMVLILLLVSAWVVAPLVWLIGRLRHRDTQSSLTARIVPWLAVLSSVIAVAFFLIVFVLLIGVVLKNENKIALVLGAPREWFGVYLLPLLFAACAMGLAITVARAWGRREWGTGQRVYYAMLALAAVALVVWFGANGLLVAFLS